MARKIMMSAIAVMCVQSTFVTDVTAASADQLSSNAGRKAKTSLEIEEVLVTARRREETLTTVPVSITAFSSDALERFNIQSFADYATRIPNLTFQYGQGSSDATLGFSGGRQTIIRGVAGQYTTAYYINDTPVPASVSPSMLNLNRIEVLKGPQGTLFGASSMGGNLRFITKEPSLTENNYSMEVEAGTTQGDGGADYRADGMGSFVLVPDKVALNAAFGYARESGFINRRFPDSFGDLITKDDQGRIDEYSGSLSLRVQVTDNFRTTLGVIGQKSDMTGFPAAYVPLPDYKPLTYTVDRDRDVQEYSNDQWMLSSLALNYESDRFSVASSTSYFDRKVEEKEDDTEGTNFYYSYFEETPLANNPAFEAINFNKDKRITHETRFSFNDGAIAALPRLSGIMGVFYQQTKRSFQQPAIYVPELEPVLFPGASPWVNSQHGKNTEDNRAIFGELYYDLVPDLLSLTLGVRQYWIEQTSDPLEISGIFGSDYVPELKIKQSGHVPKAVLSYKLSETGTLYASASQGFRLGGIQPPIPPGLCDTDLADIGYTIEQTTTYEPDELWSYEVGAKNRFDNGISVSSAVFQLDWDNIQQGVLLPQCGFLFTSNAGKARIRGAEMEVSGQPFEDIPLNVQFGLGYTDGVLLDPGLIPQEPNTRLVQTPEWTGTISGYYERSISDGATLFTSLDYSYTGSIEVAKGDGSFATRQSFNMVNGNIGVRFGNSQIMFYGKNLLDKRLNYGDLASSGFDREELLPGGDTQRLPRAAVSRPRQIGLQYRLDF